MKAVARNLIIEKIEEITTQTDGGLFLSKTDRTDIRYIEAVVVSVGEEVEGLKEEDKIFYDRHAGHQIEIDNSIYHVIKAQDVVVVL